MRTTQETWIIVVLLLILGLVVVGLFVLWRRSLAPVNRRRHISVRRACSAMHDINPAVACADPICKDAAACQETRRAIDPPSEAECDDACDELDKRIREDPTSELDLCSYSHCAHMPAYISDCQACSIEYPQLCTDEGEYAEAIELECGGVLPADPEYARCVAACADLTEGGTQPDEACFVQDGFCSWEYKDTCHPCSYEELDECTDVELGELVALCSETVTVPLPDEFQCDNNTGAAATRVGITAKVAFFTASPIIVINDVDVDNTKGVIAVAGYNQELTKPSFGIFLATQMIPCVEPSVVKLVPQSEAGMVSTMTIMFYQQGDWDTALVYMKRDRTILSMTATPVVLPVGGRFLGAVNGTTASFIVWFAAMTINHATLADGEHLACTINQASDWNLAVGQVINIEITTLRLDEKATTAEKAAGKKLMKKVPFPMF